MSTPAETAPEAATPRSARPARGQEVELEIDSLAQGGRGVARAEGYVVFVSGGLPGDRVRARISKSKRSHGEATALEILRPSPDRIADTCMHDGEPCPGAAWQGLPYERQLAEKQRQVDEALRRIGHLDGFELEEIEPAAEQWRYRNKLEYSFGEREGESLLGFHRRGSWEEVVDVDDCHLASAASNDARNAVRDVVASRGDRCVGPAQPNRRAAKPGRPRLGPHRAGPDPAGHVGGLVRASARRPAHG